MEKVYEYIEENKDKYIEWLYEAARQPSIAAQNRGMKEMASLVEDFLQQVGADVEQVPTSGNPVVYGEIKNGNEKTLSFYNHYDVQPEDPLDQWVSKPFEPEIREDKIYGRGIADNKGPLFSRICAVHAYRQVYGELPIDVKFIVEGEEEIGSPHLEEFAENNREKVQTDGLVWEYGYITNNGRPSVILGVKGMLYVELRAKGANIDIHSSNGAIIKNPAWRLVWALSTLKDQDDNVLIPGFYDAIEEPTKKEMELLNEMELNEVEMLEQWEVDGFINELSGLPLKKKFYYEPTCTICGFDSGYTGDGSKTILPAEAKVKLDFRLVAGQDPKEILQALRAHLDEQGFTDIEIVKLNGDGQHAAKTDLEDPFVKTIIEQAGIFYNKSPKIERTSAGTSPMYTLGEKYDIPAVGFGVSNEQSQQHAPNENIKVKDFIEGIKFAATVIHEFAK